MLADGEPALFAERGGRTLHALREPEAAWLEPAARALAEAVAAGRPRRLAVERFDGEPVLGSPAEGPLLAAGFLAGPRRLVLGSRR